MDTTEWLHFHFLLSCIGEGNGNPLQCSCLENHWRRIPPGGAWWASIYGVTQSQMWLKLFSSSRSMLYLYLIFSGTFILLCIMVASVCIPTISVWGFPFLHTLFNIYCLYIFWWWPFWLVLGDTLLYFWCVLL